MMMGGMAKATKGSTKDSKMIDNAVWAAESFGKISYIFNEDNQATDFCMGLVFANEASKVVLNFGRKHVTKQS